MFSVRLHAKRDAADAMSADEPGTSRGATDAPTAEQLMQRMEQLSVLTTSTGAERSAFSTSSSAPPLPVMGDAIAATSRYVRLNVGGQLFHTTVATLTKHDCMLRAMFSGRIALVSDADGWVLIDRSGQHFALLLNFMRDNSVALPNDQHHVHMILQEAKYYCLQGLIDQCEQWLSYAGQIANVDSVNVCRVPIISTPNEERAIVNAAVNPVIKLLLNRHNNKYSYTSQSDDNLLKNMELFDKLVTRFNSRIVFIKDVGAANEVCSWTFYGGRRKIAEVCCTSIVYATDKKHTKVEFPEARIFEEAMNILLFESSTHPPPHRLSSSASSAAVAAVPHVGEPLLVIRPVDGGGSSSEPSSPTPSERARQMSVKYDQVARARRELNK